jgi:hypothetical protein
VVGENATAWQAFSITDILLALAGLAGLSVGVVVLLRLSVSYPVAGSSVAAGFGAIAIILIVFRLIDPPGGNADVGREFGAWVGLISAIAITLGGYLGMQPLKAAPPVSAG